MRKRRFWFGWRAEYGPAPNLRKWIPGVALELPTAVSAVSADSRAVPVAIGGSGKVKVTADGGHDGTADSIHGYRKARARLKVKSVVRDEVKAWSGGVKTAPVTGRHEGAVGAPGIDYSPPRRSLGEMLRLQGLPEDWLKHQPWTQAAKRKMVGNGVPIPMGRALAQAIQKALEGLDSS
jgi:site-specific DNA-cytosine methylase